MGTAGAAPPSRESNEGASVGVDIVVVVVGSLSPGILMAGARVGAVVEIDAEGGARPRPSERGGASVDDTAAAMLVAVVGAAVPEGLPNNPNEGFGASAFGAAGGASSEVVVGVTVEVRGLVGSVLVTVIAGRVVGAAVLDNPPLPALAFGLAPEAFELVTRALSFSNALASASRFSSILSICRPGIPLAPAGRAHDVRPFCKPDHLGIPPPGVVTPFRAGVLALPPPLGSETAVGRPGVASLMVAGSRRESRFDRPGVVGMEPIMGLGLVGKLELDTPRILPLFHISALPGESPPDPGSFGEHEGNGNLFSLPGSCSSSRPEQDMLDLRLLGLRSGVEGVTICHPRLPCSRASLYSSSVSQVSTKTSITAVASGCTESMGCAEVMSIVSK